MSEIKKGTGTFLKSQILNLKFEIDACPLFEIFLGFNDLCLRPNVRQTVALDDDHDDLNNVADH
jgi:hypothetical protein